MSAEYLRETAQMMRETCLHTSKEPWRVVPVANRSDVRGLPENTSYDLRGDAVATAADSEFGACSDADAQHIAHWHPGVALAVADWLTRCADDHDETPCPAIDGALTVARAWRGDA